MMNYQWQQYMIDNPDLYAQIKNATPPPPYPLDTNDVDVNGLTLNNHTIYQRRTTDDANPADNIQPLQINNTYAQYAQYQPRSAPAAQQSKNGSTISKNGNVTSKESVSVQKPPATPATPPPPLLSDKCETSTDSVLKLGNNTSLQSSSNASTVIAITPQSVHHATLKHSASNHSSTSSHHTASTVITVDNHSHHSQHTASVHSPHSHHSKASPRITGPGHVGHVAVVGSNHNHNVAVKQQIASNVVKAVTQPSTAPASSSSVQVLNLNNPMPPISSSVGVIGSGKQSISTQGGVNGVAEIIIPMDQNNYNTLLLQQMGMYGAYGTHTNHAATASATTAATNAAVNIAKANTANGIYDYAVNAHNQYPAASAQTAPSPFIQDELGDLFKDPYNPMTASPFNVYSAYDTQSHGQTHNLYATRQNNGYYNNVGQAHGGTNSYYTAPHSATTHHTNYSNVLPVQPPKSASNIYNQHQYYQQPQQNNLYHQQPSYGNYQQQQQQQQQQVRDYRTQQQPQTVDLYQITNDHMNAINNITSPTRTQNLSKINLTSPPSSSRRSNITSSNDLTVTTNHSMADNMAVEYLHRCDGTIISPNADPSTLGVRTPHNFNQDEELDAFTVGDDALFGNHMVTLVSVNWTSNIPFATVRMHTSNRIHHVPLMDLTHIGNQLKRLQAQKKNGKMSPTSTDNMNRFRIQMTNHLNKAQLAADKVNASSNNNNNNNHHNDAGNTIVIRRNPKLSDETLMKLPHLRKHRDYIRTIDVNMGPKDYNSYRVSVNSKNKDASDGDDDNNTHPLSMQSPRSSHAGRSSPRLTTNVSSQSLHSNHSNSRRNQRTPNAQQLNLNLNANLNANNPLNKKKNKRMSACEKGDLFKTELCENWVKKGHCTYGKKCHFAHGREDIRTRWRIENYKTQPCCDPARADSRLCLFGKRCNYAHPGEPLRRSHHCLYLDEEYEAEIKKDYGPNTPYPFGIYI